MTTKQEIRLEGIVPIIPTAFDGAEQIDWVAMRRLLNFACSIDVAAICLPAYASEFYKLSETERRELIGRAVEDIGHRVPVIAQANAPSAAHASDLARFAQNAGADAVAVALPRQFAVSERDLLRYFDRILAAIDVPLLLQDFNPGGPTVSPELITSLHRIHPHLRWTKLEEPMMAARVSAILDATDGSVGVLEGWGGMYMLELLPAGICGVMPGLAVADLPARIYRLAKSRRMQEAYDVFQGVLPQIVFSLQNMELYHHVEKRLLAARGIIDACIVRDLRLTLHSFDAEHIEFLNGRILALLERLQMPRCPLRIGAVAQDDLRSGYGQLGSETPG